MKYLKYLKDYNLFKENFDIEESDEESVKASKEELNKLKSRITEFNTKKSSIDTLYKSDNNKEEGLKKILGENDRNPFLVSYSSIASIENQIAELNIKSDSKAIELSNFKDRLATAESTSKPGLSDKIKEIDDKLSSIRKELDEKIKKLPELESELKDRIQKSEDDIKNWITKIQ